MIGIYGVIYTLVHMVYLVAAKYTFDFGGSCLFVEQLTFKHYTSEWTITSARNHWLKNWQCSSTEWKLTVVCVGVHFWRLTISGNLVPLLILQPKIFWWYWYLNSEEKWEQLLLQILICLLASLLIAAGSLGMRLLVRAWEWHYVYVSLTYTHTDTNTNSTTELTGAGLFSYFVFLLQLGGTAITFQFGSLHMG